MIFKTRKLYEGYQPKSGWERRAHNLWRKNVEIYYKYFELISPFFPASVRKFSKKSLHDGIILESKFTKNKVELILDGSGMIDLSPEYNYKVTFTGVFGRRGATKLQGKWWLYDEFHLSSQAPFSFHVLLTDGELEIDASNIQLKRINRKLKATAFYYFSFEGKFTKKSDDYGYGVFSSCLIPSNNYKIAKKLFHAELRNADIQLIEVLKKFPVDITEIDRNDKFWIEFYKKTKKRGLPTFDVFQTYKLGT